MIFRIINMVCSVLIILTHALSAQQGNLLPEKPGAFRVITWSVYGMSGSSFTKAETEANYKKLVAITDVVRKNPVMSELKGFDCNAKLYGLHFDKEIGYGIPCQLSFEFSYFFINKKGKEVKANIEPPHWDIEINRLNSFAGNSFGYSTPKPTEPAKAGFDYDEWNKVGEKMRHMLYTPGEKETLESGIDRYGSSTVVIYNPDRQPYWLPVTIREAFTLLLDYWRLYPEELQSEIMTGILEPEYAKFSEAGKDGYAYWGGIAGISSDSTQNQIMRINNKYWNEKLPRSAIQILSFKCPSDRNFNLNEMKERIKIGDGSYHINRFLEALDIRTLLPVIDR